MGPVKREPAPTTSANSLDAAHRKVRNRVRYSCETCREKKCVLWPGDDPRHPAFALLCQPLSRNY